MRNKKIVIMILFLAITFESFGAFKDMEKRLAKTKIEKKMEFHGVKLLKVIQDICEEIDILIDTDVKVSDDIVDITIEPNTKVKDFLELLKTKYNIVSELDYKRVTLKAGKKSVEEYAERVFSSEEIEKNGYSRICFKDRKIEKAVRDLLNIKQDDIYDIDLEKITNLDISGKNIDEIEDIGFFPNLVNLNMSGNAVRNIEPLGKLTKLKYLNCSYCWLSNIKPLENLGNLETLVLKGNAVRDLSSLNRLTKLKILDISMNRVEDISVLSNYKDLKELYGWSNYISDISYLKKLKKLEKIDLSGNMIRDIRGLNEFQGRELYLQANLIEKLSDLKKSKKLEKVDLRDNHIKDIRELKYVRDKAIIYIDEKEIGKIKNMFSAEKYLNIKGGTEKKSIEKLEKIEIKRVPFKRVYRYGEKLDIRGIEVWAAKTIDRNYARMEQVFIKDENIEGFNSKKYGINRVSVIYGGQKATFDIEISDSAEKIVFQDKKLEIEVRKQLNKEKGDIYDVELSKIKEIAVEEESDIALIEKMAMLSSIELKRNIKDIKFIEKLSNIENVSMYDMEISDITPLKNLKNLKKLYMSNNKIKNIEILSNLTKIEKLYLDNNGVDDISVLKNLENIKELSFSGNKVENIDILKDRKFEYINIGSNKINDIAAVENIIKNSKRAIVEKNPATDIPEGIRVLMPPYKTRYKRGEELEKYGLRVAKSYKYRADKYEDINIEDVTITGFNSKEEGEIELKVSAGGFEDKFRVVISERGKVVKINDKKFEREIREKTGISYGEEIYEEDLEKIKELDLSNSEISCFYELKECKNLEKLNLSNSRFDNTSAIPSLRKLKYLDISKLKYDEYDWYKIDDIKKGIMYLGWMGNSNIEYLAAENNGIEDISGLENLKSLKTVKLAGNNISDISNLKNLKELKELDLSFNRVRDITAIGENENIEELNLSGNKIKDISGIVKNQKLRKVNFMNNSIESAEVLKELNSLKYAVVKNNPFTNDIKTLESELNKKGVMLFYKKEEIKTGDEKTKEYDNSKIAEEKKDSVIKKLPINMIIWKEYKSEELPNGLDEYNANHNHIKIYRGKIIVTKGKSYLLDDLEHRVEFEDGEVYGWYGVVKYISNKNIEEKITGYYYDGIKALKNRIYFINGMDGRKYLDKLNNSHNIMMVEKVSGKWSNLKEIYKMSEEVKCWGSDGEENIYIITGGKVVEIGENGNLKEIKDIRELGLNINSIEADRENIYIGALGYLVKLERKTGKIYYSEY